MSKENFNAAEWEKVKDAPYWVHAAMHAADGRQALLANRREDKALDQAMAEYQTGNRLVRDLIANDDEPAKAIGKASITDAELALKDIAQIVERRSAEDLDPVNEFLIHLATAVAEASKEGLLGDRVSDNEAKAIDIITRALGATDADKQQRREARQEANRARLRAEADAKAAVAAKEAAERKAAAEKAAAERRAAVEKAAAEKAAKEAAELEAKREAARAQREADAKARQEEIARQAAERKAAAEKAAAEKAAAEKAAAEKAAKEAAEKAAAAKAAAGSSAAFEILAEYKVVPGDNLSFISERFYGTQAHWRKIYEANKAVIGDNPSLIRVGQLLKIPKL